MTQITLQIPDDELDFFLKLVQKFNYETEIDMPLELCKQQKDLLDHRRSKESVFLSVYEANLKIKQKYGF
ncbi:MAG: hypothetical protein H7329_04020 [Opitutaceae bacterium]|nr:hypothetical protein [Cytophagales bacterium]